MKGKGAPKATPRPLPWQTRRDGGREAGGVITPAPQCLYSHPTHSATHAGRSGTFPRAAGLCFPAQSQRGSPCPAADRFPRSARGRSPLLHRGAYWHGFSSLHAKARVLYVQETAQGRSQPAAQHRRPKTPPASLRETRVFPPPRTHRSYETRLRSSHSNFCSCPSSPEGPRRAGGPLASATPAPGASSSLTHAGLAPSHLGHELCVDLGHRRGHDFLGLSWSRHGSTLPPLRWERKARSEHRGTRCTVPGSGCGSLPTPGKNLRPGSPQPSQPRGEHVQQPNHSPGSGTELSRKSLLAWGVPRAARLRPPPHAPPSGKFRENTSWPAFEVSVSREPSKDGVW